jgi:hypothetical protein
VTHRIVLIAAVPNCPDESEREFTIKRRRKREIEERPTTAVSCV